MASSGAMSSYRKHVAGSGTTSLEQIQALEQSVGTMMEQINLLTKEQRRTADVMERLLGGGALPGGAMSSDAAMPGASHLQGAAPLDDIRASLCCAATSHQGSGSFSKGGGSFSCGGGGTANGPAPADNFRGDYRTRVGSFDLTGELDELHRENDEMRINAASMRMTQQDDSRLREQELRKISKLQREEVYGMDAELVNRKREVMERSARNAFVEAKAAMKRCLLMPQGRFRLWWDGTSCVLVFFMALALPYRSAFATDWSLVWALVDFFIDLFFIVDIFVNLRTMHYDDQGELVSNQRQIFMQYARSWLVIDLVASTPIDWFSQGISFVEPEESANQAAAAQLTQLLRIFRLIKLVRLLRVARLFRYLGKWEAIVLAHFNSNWIRLFKQLGFLLLFSHWNGCIQYVLAALDTLEVVDANGNPTGELEIHPEAWVVRANITGPNAGANENIAWSWCFYHAMTQLLAISVGVVPPRRPGELWGYLISITFGAALYAVFVASLTAVFTELGASGREYRSKIDMLHQYMRNLRMPSELKRKLHSYFELMFPEKQMFHEQEILESLSHPLQSQVALLKCHNVLTALRVLHDENLARTIALYLERVVFIDEDYVIRMGELGRGMYFISTGTVEIFVRGSTVPMTTLGKHSFFGEMALLDRFGRSSGDVRVKGFCEGYHLSRAHFYELLKQFPEFKSYIENVARLRLENLKEGRASGRYSMFMKQEKSTAKRVMPIHQRLKRKALEAGPGLSPSEAQFGPSWLLQQAGCMLSRISESPFRNNKDGGGQNSNRGGGGGGQCSNRSAGQSSNRGQGSNRAGGGGGAVPEEGDEEEGDAEENFDTCRATCVGSGAHLPGVASHRAVSFGPGSGGGGGNKHYSGSCDA